MANNPDKLVPNDPRVQYKTAKLNGRTYGYILGEPKGNKKGTIFLIHGFPDLGFGWRYQIPYLMGMGMRVVAPDMMGYGRTDAPSHNLQAYGYAQCASDMEELARQLGEPKIVVAGHDWGGAVVYRLALHLPHLVTHCISLATPYFLPQEHYLPLAHLISHVLPDFGYQAQFASGICEETLPSDRATIQGILLALHGARNPESKKGAFLPKQGLLFDELPKLDPASVAQLMSADELDFYLDEYTRPRSAYPSQHPMTGPWNWYRVREINWLHSDLPLLQNAQKSSSPETKSSSSSSPPQPPPFPCPVLFIPATKDTVLTKELGKAMPEQISDLTIREFEASHWVLVERPDEVNRAMGEWIAARVFGEEMEEGKL